MFGVCSVWMKGRAACTQGRLAGRLVTQQAAEGGGRGRGRVVPGTSRQSVRAAWLTPALGDLTCALRVAGFQRPRVDQILNSCATASWSGRRLFLLSRCRGIPVRRVPSRHPCCASVSFVTCRRHRRCFKAHFLSFCSEVSLLACSSFTISGLRSRETLPQATAWQTHRTRNQQAPQEACRRGTHRHLWGRRFKLVPGCFCEQHPMQPDSRHWALICVRAGCRPLSANSILFSARASCLPAWGCPTRHGCSVAGLPGRQWGHTSQSPNTATRAATA